MRPLRNRDPSLNRLITIRTVESRLWIPANGRTRRIIGGIIARYQEAFDIIIYAYAILGNHYHMLIQAPKQNTDEFCENVNREIARRINWIHGRKGPLWSRRYTDQAVASDDDLLEAFLYVVTNSSHHGLIKNPKDWPGLNCYQHVIDQKDREFFFTHYSKPVKRRSRHFIKLSPLPGLKDMSRKQRAKRLYKLLQERRNYIVEQKQGQFLTPEILARQIAGSKPKSSKYSRRAPFYTKNKKLVKELRTEWAEARVRYTQSSYRYRLGDDNVIFPDFTYKPPTHRVPRGKRILNEDEDDFLPAA